MITEIVQFALPEGIGRSEVLAMYRQTAYAWSQNSDLVQKYYFFDHARGLGGGVYVWKSLEAAHRWHGDEYKARVLALYGSEPRMEYYDTLVVVDNASHQLYEPAEA